MPRPESTTSVEEKLAIDSFFGFYNQDYPHSALKGMSPGDSERSLNQTQAAAT